MQIVLMLDIEENVKRVVDRLFEYYKEATEYRLSNNLKEIMGMTQRDADNILMYVPKMRTLMIEENVEGNPVVLLQANPDIALYWRSLVETHKYVSA